MKIRYPVIIFIAFFALSILIKPYFYNITQISELMQFFEVIVMFGCPIWIIYIVIMRIVQTIRKKKET